MSARSVLAQWSRLGIAWNIPPSGPEPDLEPLIIRSMHDVPSNPRLLVLIASWLSRYWRCVGRDRLRTLALHQPPFPQATLGLLLQSVDAWLPTPVFATVYTRLSSLPNPEPLSLHDRERPALRRLIELESTDLARAWGLLSLPIEQKLDAIRPTAWTLRHNPRIRTRSLFKGALKTSLLAVIDQHPAPPSPTQLARECGVTRKAVYDALEDLKFSGLMPAAGHFGKHAHAL